MTRNKTNIVPFEMKYLNEYYDGFNSEITKYQWPDPFNNIDEARELLQEFLDEMERGETLLFSVLDSDERFVGSVEIHGLSEDCPELGVWIAEAEQGKGYVYEALSNLLVFAKEKYGKQNFFYEADVRNAGSILIL